MHSMTERIKISRQNAAQRLGLDRGEARVLVEKARAAARRHGFKGKEVELIRKGLEVNRTEFEPGERAVVSYISTAAVDRDGEVMRPDGAVLSEYRRHPIVLWAHRYHELPIGRNAWIKADDKGLRAKTIYANHDFAQTVYRYRRDGFPLAQSIGFIPLESFTSHDAHFADELKAVVDQGWVDKTEAPRVRAVHKRWLLYEYSDCVVPVNPEALTVAVSKGLVSEDEAEAWQIRWTGFNKEEKSPAAQGRGEIFPQGL